MTPASSSARAGSFANVQGALSSTYRFTRLASFCTAVAAPVKSTSAMQASYSAYSPSAISRSGLSSEPAGASGTRPSKYFVVMFVTRETRLPQVLAKSALYTCTMRSMEMEPSWPNCTSLMK